MSYFLWGCRGILTLITLRSERVNQAAGYTEAPLPPPTTTTTTTPHHPHPNSTHLLWIGGALYDDLHRKGSPPLTTTTTTPHPPHPNPDHTHPPPLNWGSIIRWSAQKRLTTPHHHHHHPAPSTPQSWPHPPTPSELGEHYVMIWTE